MTPYYGNEKFENGNPKSEIRFEIQNLWCRPCSKIGYKKCPLGHFKCMELQNINEIQKTVQLIVSH